MRLKLSLGVVVFTLPLLAAGPSSTVPTFNKDVAPILYQNCSTCHHPGEVAPFSLLSYSDAKRYAPVIADATSKHVMPPWKAEAGFGDFQNVRMLSDAQIATLTAWAKNGAPEGDAKDKVAPPQFNESWALGEPDQVIKMPSAFNVPADGNDIYRCFVIPMSLTSDMAISAVDIHPGNRRVVHHTIIYTDASPTHEARALAAKESDGAYTCYGGPGLPQAGMMAGWAPGVTAKRLPEGIARVVPKGADLIVQIHYHPDGKPETDKTEIGVYLQKGAVSKQLFSIPVLQRALYIPAGDSHFRVATSFTTPIDLEVTSVAPHMHLLGREMKVTATLPSGEVRPMVWIKDWDFNWQGSYIFKEPMQLPKGTRFDVEAFYDNSTGNPRNPANPPKTVSWGEATTDEMCIAFIGYMTPRPSDRMTLMMSLAKQLDLMKYPDLTGQRARVNPKQ
jgi:hypothetical protein